MPEQDAMIPRVGDGEHAVVRRDADRHVARRRRDLAARVAALAAEIGLTEDRIRWRAIRGRGMVPDEDAVMARVGDDERPVGARECRAARAEERVRRWHDRPRERAVRTRLAPENDAGPARREEGLGVGAASARAVIPMVRLRE